MKDRLGDKLPKFTDEEKEMLIGSSDFFGLNHYTTMYAAHKHNDADEGSVYGNGGISEDQDVILSVDSDWALTEMQWAVVPWGCNKLLHWIDERYGSPEIVITENGCAFDDHIENDEINDTQRIDYYNGYLNACHDAIQNGVKLKGYFAWSFMDNFEWASGYSKRFGIHYVDYKTLKRTPKASAKWFKKVMTNNGLGD